MTNKKNIRERNSTKESKTKILIREYLLNEGHLRGNLKDPKLDFGFRFEFPTGKTPDGKPTGRNFIVVRPKKKDFIEISSSTRISPEHVKALNSLKDMKKEQFFSDIRKLFFLQNVFFQIDFKNYRYAVIDRIYLTRNGTVSKDFFYRIVRKLFNCVVYSIILLHEYTMGKVKPEDFSTFRSSDPSLYL